MIRLGSGRPRPLFDRAEKEGPHSHFRRAWGPPALRPRPAGQAWHGPFAISRLLTKVPSSSPSGFSMLIPLNGAPSPPFPLRRETWGCGDKQRERGGKLPVDEGKYCYLPSRPAHMPLSSCSQGCRSGPVCKLSSSPPQKAFFPLPDPTLVRKLGTSLLGKGGCSSIFNGERRVPTPYLP